MRLVFGTCGHGDPGVWSFPESPRVAGSGAPGCGTWQAAPLALPWSADPPTVALLFCDPRPACGPWLRPRVLPVDQGCLSILALSTFSIVPTHCCRCFLPPSAWSLNFCFHSTGIPLVQLTNPQVPSVNLDKSPLFLPSPTTLLPFIWQLGSSYPLSHFKPLLQTFQRVLITPECALLLFLLPPLGWGVRGGISSWSPRGFYSILLTALLSLFFFA